MKEISESAEIGFDVADSRRFAMAAAVGLRDDYEAGALRAAAKRSKDGPQARRLLARLSQLEQVGGEFWDWEGGKSESVQ